MGSCAEREKPVNVLIVGCGNIAGRFDMSNKSANYAQTHAGAYFKNKKFSITACIEPDQYRREEFMAYWKIDNGYPSFSKAIFSAAKFDVISICSPTDQHESDILSAIDLNPQIIFCEKPIAPTLKSSKAVALACEKAGIPLAVNYSRRWDMQLRDFFGQLDKGDYGQLRSVVGLYNKGILNNGSHLIDLLQLLLGDLSICSIGQKTNDYLEGDPSISAVLTTKSGISVHLVTGHSSDYSLFEVQFIFENSIITMLDGGARWQVRSRKESDVYSGYFALSIGESKVGGYAMAMENAIDNIHSCLSDGREMLSTAENSLVAQNLCESLCKAEA